MAEWEDYYAVLAVNPDSSAEEIKAAYRYKTNILHLDRLMQAPKSVRHQAEDELKKVNRAYDVLKNSQKRWEYHSGWIKHRAGSKENFAAKPKPKERPNRDESVAYIFKYTIYGVIVGVIIGLAVGVLGWGGIAVLRAVVIMGGIIGFLIAILKSLGKV